MITGLPFEIARDIAYFELFKQLTALTEADPSGSATSKMQAMAHVKDYEIRARFLKDNGLSKEELEGILEDYKTSPEALKSAATKEKRDYMIGEMTLLLKGDYIRDEFVIRLIQAYGHTKEEAVEMQKKVLEELTATGKFILSVFDHVNERLKEKISQ